MSRMDARVDVFVCHHKGGRGITAKIPQQDCTASRVHTEKSGDIIHFAINSDPRIIHLIMCCELTTCDNSGTFLAYVLWDGNGLRGRALGR